jgi:hypothetical protein
VCRRSSTARHRKRPEREQKNNSTIVAVAHDGPKMGEASGLIILPRNAAERTRPADSNLSPMLYDGLCLVPKSRRDGQTKWSLEVQPGTTPGLVGIASSAVMSCKCHCSPGCCHQHKMWAAWRGYPSCGKALRKCPELPTFRGQGVVRWWWWEKAV